MREDSAFSTLGALAGMIILAVLAVYLMNDSGNPPSGQDRHSTHPPRVKVHQAVPAPAPKRHRSNRPLAVKTRAT